MNDNLRQQYDAEGYCIARNVLDAGLVQEASDHIAWLMRKHPDLRPEDLHSNLMSDDAFWVRLVSDDRLLDIAEQFVGPDIALFASHYIAKPPFDGQPVLWHQDSSYWPLEPMAVVSLWLAVDDADPDNGCLRVIPGTHTMPSQPLQAKTDTANVLGSQIDPALVDESNAVDICLNAGDVEIHHPQTIHGSNANNSPRRRAGLTIRYIPTSTRIMTTTQWPSAFLLRGQAVPGVNHYLPWPTWDAGTSMAFQGFEAWNEQRASADLGDQAPMTANQRPSLSGKANDAMPECSPSSVA
jgi:ectoine hydroxylase-related dioxygenase (phytanoyl-CoA dioxygenase family)